MKIQFSSAVAEYLAKAMEDLVDGPADGPDATEGMDLLGSTLDIGTDDRTLPTLTLRSKSGEVARFTAPGWDWERLYVCANCDREQWLDRAPDGDECNCRSRPSTENEDRDR